MRDSITKLAEDTGKARWDGLFSHSCGETSLRPTALTTPLPLDSEGFNTSQLTESGTGTRATISATAHCITAVRHQPLHTDYSSLGLGTAAAVR